MRGRVPGRKLGAIAGFTLGVAGRKLAVAGFVLAVAGRMLGVVGFVLGVAGRKLAVACFMLGGIHLVLRVDSTRASDLTNPFTNIAREAI